MTEHFRCIPYSVNLSRSSCGKRHREASCGSRPGIMRPIAASCVTCPIGAAHAKGKAPAEWPNGRPVELVQISGLAAPELMPASKKVQSRIPAADRSAAGRGRQSKLVRGPKGERRTVAAWAEILGVNPKVIHTRLGLGWAEDRAVSQPHAHRGRS